MKQNQESNGAIVLNRMFVGDYCLENIGHEIINIFQADNGHYYIYLNSLGTFAADKKGMVKYVLLTRNCPIPNTVQVIGKATVVKELYDPLRPVDQKKDSAVKSICYGGARIVDLFNANTLDQNVYVTYEVDRIVEPKKDLFVSFDNVPDSKSESNILYLNKKNIDPSVKMARASLKQYFDMSEPFAYEVLLNAINDKSLWKSEPFGKVVLDGNVTKTENFFKICRIDNDELAFSNAFAYLAKKYRARFCQFAQEVLKEDVSDGFELHREKWNIDILIADNTKTIVIENKVFSHINGLWFDRKEDRETSQLEKYWNIITGQEDRFNKKNEESGKREYEGLDHKFYVLAPDHNNIDLGKYTKGECYVMIHYSQVRDFIRKFKTDDPFVEQLLLAMEPHCQKSYDFYGDMKASFLEQCKRANTR